MVNKSIVKEDLERIYESMSKRNLSFFEDSNILVTGASGFIGYYILSFLSLYRKELRIGRIAALDNFMLGEPEWIKRIDKNDDRVSVFPFDIAHDRLDTILGNEDYNVVIHMASIASPTYYRKFPLATIDANVWGLRNLLDFFSSKEVKGFLNFSSSEVYGNPESRYVPINEEYKGSVAFNGPRSCYDEAKRFGETLSYVYFREFGMNVTSVRPFNNYGPGMKMDDGRAPADFAKAVLDGRPIEVFSDGSPTRTFSYISDAVTGYLKALSYGKFDYFNIGIDRPEVSIDELAEIYADEGREAVGYKGHVVHAHSTEREYLHDNPQRRCPDIKKARELLKFDPKIEVQEGVRRFLLFLKGE